MADDALSSPLLASFRAHYRELLRYLALRTGNADEARDLAHDAWLRAADLAQQGREPMLATDGEARAYLFTMARNLVIDHRRREGVAQRHAEGQSVAQSVLHAPDAADAAMYGQAIAAVEVALAGLPERAREVFLRHRIQGEDQGALALAFGISRNMVERDMMLAMDRVQAALEQWHAGQGEAAAPARRRGRRRSLTALLSLAGLSAGGLGALTGWRWWRTAVPQWQQMARTGRGQTLRQPLPDGGSLTLDAQSRVEIAYFAARRHVRLLAGAVFFDVAADAERPFVVDVPESDAGGMPHRARGVRITVLGTRFAVERLPKGAVDVQVETGRVRVERVGDGGMPHSMHELVPGEGWRGAGGDDAPPVLTRLARAQPVAGWRHGVLAFDDAPLGDTVERLRRYLPRPVDVAPAIASLRLSGQVRIVQAEDFLRALPGILPVRSRLAQGRWQIEPRS